MRKKNYRSSLCVSLLFLCMSGYAMAETAKAVDTTEAALASTDTSVVTADPFRPFNKVMFQFNMAFDILIFKPAATLYSAIMPKPFSRGISNFFNNLDGVPTVINDVLQLRLGQTVHDAWRLGLNSTIGIAGFFDVATPLGLERNSEDFGLTLARWGYKNSNYLVLPFIGPSTLRDGIAWPINYYFMTVYPYIGSDTARYAIYTTGSISKRAEYLRYQGVVDQVAFDKYIFMREAYLQNRKQKIDIDSGKGIQNGTTIYNNTQPIAM